MTPSLLQITDPKQRLALRLVAFRMYCGCRGIELCGGKGGKPGPCPEGAHGEGGGGGNKPAVVKISRPVRSNKPTPRKPEKPINERAARAKASYNPSTKEKQDESDRLEHKVTTALDGVKSGDNLPMDVTSVDGKIGVEVKMIHDAKDHRINMRPDSRARKEAWLKEKKGRKAFIVAVDNRDSFQGGAHKDKYSGHKFYVSRVIGAVSLNTMTKASSLAEVAKLTGFK